MVSTTGTGPAGSSMSLKDVVKEIKETNKRLDVQGTALTDFIAELKFQRSTQGLEDKREGKKPKKGGSAIPFISPIANLNKEGLGLGFFLNPMSIISAMMGNLTAVAGGILAITAATAGLKGWALKPVESIKKWASWGDKIVDGAKSVRTALFTSFGLDKAGKLLDDTKAKFKIGNPFKKIGMRLNALKLGMFKSFGLDATGKALGGADDVKIPKANIWQRFKFQFGRIMNPIKNISAGIAKYASGPGKAIFSFFGKIGALGGGLLGKIGGVFGKILAPLGIFLSVKAAFDEWMLSEESSLMKQGTDFIGTFLGNFLGAPLDLLKSLIFGVAKLIGFDVDQDTGAFKALKDLSIEKLLTTALQNLLDAPRQIFDFLVKSFTDPEYFNEQWMKFKEKLSGLLDKVFGFITGIFSGDEEPEISVKDMNEQQKSELLAKNKQVTLDRIMALRALDKNNDGILSSKEVSGRRKDLASAAIINRAFGSGKAATNFRNIVAESGGLDLNAAEAQAQAMPIIIDGSTTNGPSTQNITNLTPMGDVSEPYSKDYMRSLFGG